MTEWKARRFWTAATVTETADGLTVSLDARPVRTPGKLPLILPTRAMAEAVAAEWDAQSERIDPLSMPVTRAANSAIEKVRPQRDAVVAEIARYGGTDLLCYRAAEPPALAAQQAEAWDPWLTWAANALDAPLAVQHGLMPVAQPPESLARLATAVDKLDSFELTGFHDLVALSGSLVLAFAVIRDRLDPAAAWDLSRIDEAWQTALWGHDDEAAAQAAARRAAFLAGARFYRLAQVDTQGG